MPLHSLTPELSTTFFDSLRNGYNGFDDWFRKKSRENRKAWVYRDETGVLGALCVYDVQTNEVITEEGHRLEGKALKLCTFKVGQSVRGRKIGELFLKAAFRFGAENACEHIFIHADGLSFSCSSLYTARNASNCPWAAHWCSTSPRNCPPSMPR